jgi:hypothetical protein
VSMYSAPTTDQVDEVMRRITKTQLRRAFFEGLENPLWVEPLAAAGAFRNPPEPTPSADGLLRETYWPQATYLAKVAVSAPQEVVDVLLTLSGATNSWVRRLVFQIAASIPAEHAVQLQPLVKGWLPSGLGWRTDPTDVVQYAVNLLEGGYQTEGRWIANVLFKPTRGSTGKPGLVLEEYWYEQSLPPYRERSRTRCP